jgi:hypothetical protein
MNRLVVIGCLAVGTLLAADERFSWPETDWNGRRHSVTVFSRLLRIRADTG